MLKLRLLPFLSLVLPLLARADVTTYVSLCNSNNSATVNYAVHTNDIISYTGGNSSVVKGFTPSSGPGGITMQQYQPAIIYTGLTNLQVSISSGTLAYATFSITTPALPANVQTNGYLPADCVMIPTSASGNCNVILESSADLLNWTAASPGLYGPGSATNRFFRVRINCQ